jgi:LysR family glycine cleavage system transcriptional activator
MARGVEGVDARKGLRLNLSSLVIEAAIAGKGVALAKRQLAAADIALGRLVAPFGESATPLNFAYWMVWPRGRTLSPALRAFMAWLREEAKEGELEAGAGI